MLKVVGFDSLDSLVDATVPEAIRSRDLKELERVPHAATESEALEELKEMASLNMHDVVSLQGMGYHPTKVPSVVLRNMLENPAWYTAYTPYQAEISQGRLEMLLNFQTMVSDLTSTQLANCSLLDEASAAAEGLTMAEASLPRKIKNTRKFFVSNKVHPQTLGCVQTRAELVNCEVVVGDVSEAFENPSEYSGVLMQYPDTVGNAVDFSEGISQAKAKDPHVKFVVSTDLLSLTLLKPPGEMGADIVVGSAQRFGVPMWNGGPHAGWLSTSESLKRVMPGRIIGVSKDSQNKKALRMALQTREQFIKREKATSNICTAQALLANAAAAYGIYHGPEGLLRIANDVRQKTVLVANECERVGLTLGHVEERFDTLTLKVEGAERVRVDALNLFNLNVRVVDERTIGMSMNERVDLKQLTKVLNFVRHLAGASNEDVSEIISSTNETLVKQTLRRESPFMTHPVFNSHQTETQMLRYLSALEAKDLTLRNAMIPLGSCTMKLNAASELLPISWPQFTDVHPFAPEEQRKGYDKMIGQLDDWLASLTGFAAVSTQPNSGATGEFAGLMAIKAYHESNNDSKRTKCLIPMSAHGTNPASAHMCGMDVVGVKADADGNVDMDDLNAKISKHGAETISALMITYPSTYGKFEEKILEIISTVHDAGGLVYMDGANMNAQLGLTSPGRMGADVCHLNLHKTFAIPHGGGGPGVGSIGVAERLAPFLPGHCVVPVSGEGKSVVEKTNKMVAAAPYGSAGILPISWMFVRMLGKQGLENVSRVAILNANYMATKLSQAGYEVMFRRNDLCAHEFILNFSKLSKYGLSENDVAKRLSDFGFHAPTTSWPVHGTLMIEPTESESKQECDRMIEALIIIKKEIDDVVQGRIPAKDSPLANAPHTAAMVSGSTWDKAYSREQAAFPAPPPNGVKFWPAVGRVDNAYGDRNLICSCPPMESYE